MLGKKTKTLSFKYKKLSDKIVRPLIRVELAFKRGENGVPCEVLVDSGADCCIIKAEIGEILGVDIKSGDPFTYRGISGSESVGYAHNIWIAVKDCWIQARVVFSYDVPKGGHQVVGQVGFFDKFKINFDYQEGNIVLRSK